MRAGFTSALTNIGTWLQQSKEGGLNMAYKFKIAAILFIASIGFTSCDNTDQFKAECAKHGGVAVISFGWPDYCINPKTIFGLRSADGTFWFKGDDGTLEPK
jgi:hypothetical protein